MSDKECAICGDEIDTETEDWVGFTVHAARERWGDDDHDTPRTEAAFHAGDCARQARTEGWD